jgi:hypothetical protein
VPRLSGYPFHNRGGHRRRGGRRRALDSANDPLRDDLGFPATQKQLAITGTTFVRFKDGKAVEGWDNWDMLGLMNAIGQSPYTRAIPLEKTP